MPPDWIPAGDVRGGSPAPIPLIAVMRLGDGMELGVGRFSMLDFARPRTNMEREPRPTDIERRQMKSERLHGANDRPHRILGQAPRANRRERLVQGPEIFDQFTGPLISSGVSFRSRARAAS